MRNVLLFLVVLAVMSPAMAGREEQILQQSDDTMETSWGMDDVGAVQWFEAPADCYILSASFYCFCGLATTKDVAVWDNDDSGSDDLPGTLLGSVSNDFDYGGSWAWSDYIDLTSLGLTMSDGEKFWLGIPESPGPGFQLGRDITDPDHGYAFTSYGSDWIFWSGYDVMLRVKIDDDMDPPYVDGQNPADGGWVQPDTDIVFHCKDDDKGVDSETIGFSADDGTRADVSGSLDIDDSDPNDVVCTFTPDSDLPEDETTTCTVPGGLADRLGNEMGDDTVWSFGVDGTAPEITQEYPTGGRTSGGTASKAVSMKLGSTITGVSYEAQGMRSGVDPSTNIGWHIEDNAAGCLFADCVYSVKVGGSDVPVSEDVTDDGTTDVTVVLDPTSDLNPGDVVDVSVQAMDIAGNTMDAPYEWSFTVGYTIVDDASLGEVKAKFR
jgi:hypothetical protein